MSTKRTILLLVVACLTLAAALGVWILLFDGFFGIEGEIFGTLGTLFLFALPGLVAAGMAERNHWRHAMWATTALCVLGALMFLAIIWIDRPHVFHGDWYWRGMVLVTIWAWALPWAAALASTRFTNAFHWVRLASIVMVICFAAVLTLLVLTETFDHEVGAKLLGILGIFVALGTISTPILYRATRIERAASIDPTLLRLKLTCPRCLLEQTVGTGESRCVRCRLKFHIEMEEPRCPGCGYLLHMLTEPRCPECGLSLAPDEVARGN